MKVGYTLLDGCADRPHPKLNFTTPLEAASTPNLDKIATSGQLGRVVTVGRGISPESDIAVFNMLGYSFDDGYPGRGVVETVGSDIPFKDGELALRANFATVKGTAIFDRRAGRDLASSEAAELAEDLKAVELDGATLEFKSTVSYRGVLVIRANRALSAEITNTDPAYAKVRGFGAARETKAGEKILRCHPESRKDSAALAARLVNQFTEESLALLAKSRVNKERISRGKLPANAVLLRDAGDHLPRPKSFEDNYAMKGVALVEMPAEVGIARLLQMKMVRLKDSNDLKGKAETFSRELREGTLVYVHIKGPDEFGHDGDVFGKKRNIEMIDSEFFSVVAEKMGAAKIAISCDHATPCAMKMHSSDPVPLLITGGGDADKGRFTERASKKGSLGLLRGRDVLKRVLAA